MTATATRPFGLGDEVEVIGHYTWCGSDVHGQTGYVETIEEYPAEVIDRGVLYMVRRPGKSPMPMLERELRLRVVCAACDTGTDDLLTCETCGVTGCRCLVDTADFACADPRDGRDFCQDHMPAHRGCPECDPDYARDLALDR